MQDDRNLLILLNLNCCGYAKITILSDYAELSDQALCETDNLKSFC